MQLRSFGLSDIGLVRSKNEDAWAALPEVGFFALADGMGGHKAGDIAAKEAIDSLMNAWTDLKRENPKDIISEMRQAIQKANLRVYQAGKKSKEFSGMGTTLCCLLWVNQFIVYAHIGDSRIYRLRKKKLELLTEDHSLLNKWKATGKKSSTPYPYKHVITRALGTQSRVIPEIAVAPHEMQDLYVLSTDGLHDVLSLQEMEDTINHSDGLEKSCKNLIQLAKLKNSSDNITLLMVQSSY